MLKPGIARLLYLNRGQILLRVGSTYRAAGDVALVPQKGTGVAASGGGEGALEDSWRGLSIRSHIRRRRLLLLLHTHPDLRRAPRSLVGIKHIDLVVPPPTPEQRVSDHGLRDKRER